MNGREMMGYDLFKVLVSVEALLGTTFADVIVMKYYSMT
jgi:hypothetical protein